MNYIELSLEDVKNKSINLAEIIQEEYKPEVIIFISKGAFQIGHVLSDYFNIPLLEIFAKRKVGKLKKIISPILKIIPKKLKKYLREKEVKSNIHESNTERNVFFDEKEWVKYIKNKRVLIVDDSVDTGNTILQVKLKVEEYFKNADVRIAVFNIFDKSRDVVNVNYTIYKNTMLNGPWSSDSKYNKSFCEMYEKWRKIKYGK